MARLLIGFINLVIAIIETLLLARFLLVLFGASTQAGFTALILGISEFFLRPFLGMFPPTVIEGATIEWNTIIAMIVYAFGGYVLISVIGLLFGPRRNVVVVEEDSRF
jgi:hypothetical protein